MNRRNFLKLTGAAICIPGVPECVSMNEDEFDPTEQLFDMRSKSLSTREGSDEYSQAVDSMIAELMQSWVSEIPAPYRKYVHWHAVYYENGNAAIVGFEPERNVPLHNVTLLCIYRPNVKAPTEMTYSHIRSFWGGRT